MSNANPIDAMIRMSQCVRVVFAAQERRIDRCKRDRGRVCRWTRWFSLGRSESMHGRRDSQPEPSYLLKISPRVGVPHPGA